MRWLLIVLITIMGGCAHQSMDSASDSASDFNDVVFIETEFWTNVPPPSETEVNRQLANAIGRRITINGARHEQDGVAAIWIPENIVILVPDRKEWKGAPSHRSHLMVTGTLHHEDTGYYLTETSYEWLDS